VKNQPFPHGRDDWKKVGSVHPILSVRILGDAWNDHFALLAVNDRKLHLHKYAGKIGLVAPLSVKQRGSRVPPVYDLQVRHPDDLQMTILHPCLNGLSIRRHAVIVGEKHTRFGQDRSSDAFIYLSPRLQKRSDVLLQKPGTVTVIQLCLK
jgi:hypothetical protein